MNKMDKNLTEAYIDVAISLPTWKTYTYAVPADLKPLVQVGKRVLVPFNNRRLTGYIIGEGVVPEGFTVKPLIDILDDSPLFHPSHLPFFSWISNYYLFPLGEVIKSALPGGLNTQDATMVSLTAQGKKTLLACDASGQDMQILTALEKGARSSTTLLRFFEPQIKHSVISTLVKKNQVCLSRELKKGLTGHKFEPCVRLKDNSPNLLKLSDKRKEMISFIRGADEIALRDLKNRFPNASAHVKFLEKEGVITCFDKKIHRDPFGESIPPDNPPALTDEQQQIVTTVKAALGKGFSSFLLAGVTGSGKTEVYMQLVQKALENGLNALVLVPEIALISQTERRFRMRFGDQVAVLHSGLSRGEKFDQWMCIAEKKVSIVIGARSAIFAPLENLGIIIVDEEHDTSYKQENGLRYNARDLAVVRAKLSHAVCLLGSATPSIQSYFNASTGKFKELRLTKRVSDRPLPQIQVVDLKTYRDHPGIRSFITPPLEDAMIRTLRQKEQILLFLNRRGYANYPICATCGEPMKCISCDVSLTLHQSKNAYRCHMCNYIIPANSK